MEYDAPLPRHRELLVVVSAVEEAFNVVDRRVFHVLGHDHIIPACIMDGLPKLLAIMPSLLIEHKGIVPNIIVQFRICSNKLIDRLAKTIDKLIVTLVEDVIVLLLIALL